MLWRLVETAVKQQPPDRSWIRFRDGTSDPGLDLSFGQVLAAAETVASTALAGIVGLVFDDNGPDVLGVFPCLLACLRFVRPML